MVTRDTLCGLPDFVQFHLLARERAVGFMVVFDLDRFKAFNDLHGFQEGDRALVRIAGALRGEFPGLHRVAGAVFASLEAGPPEDLLRRAREAVAAVEAMRIPFEHPGLRVPHGPFLTVSVAVAPLPGDRSPEFLKEWREAAVYLSRKQGRPGCAFHEAGPIAAEVSSPS